MLKESHCSFHASFQIFFLKVNALCFTLIVNISILSNIMEVNISIFPHTCKLDSNFIHVLFKLIDMDPLQMATIYPRSNEICLSNFLQLSHACEIIQYILCVLMDLMGANGSDW